MIIQELTISFEDQKAPKLTSRYGEEGRQYLFTPDQELPEGASVVLQIVKPDKNFVIENADISEDKILITIPQQATVVKGIAYYNIEVQKSGLLIYSAEGEIWVDDALIDDTMIESISEVFGYKFPDDFITDDKIVPLIINDSATGTTTTWSSSFIQEKISEIQPGSTVVVNPTDSATATAEKIKVDGTTYDFPAYSDVEVNPSDAASSTMEKIKVDGTTYDLPTYPETLADLEDASIVTPAEGDLLTYDSLTGKWINDAPPAAPALDDLGDVDITTPTEGDILQYDATDETWKNTQLPPIPPVSTTVTGNPIELTDAASAPMVKCVTQITGYQEGTGTPSPDNIRPIVAYTEGEIEVRGKNIIDSSASVGWSINNSGTITSNSSYKSFYTKIEEGKTYTYSQKDAGNIIYAFFTSVPNVGSVSYNSSRVISADTRSATFTAPGDYYVVIRSDSTSTENQFEKGSTATTYEPYSSTTHTTTFPSAIYRGSEDVVNGTETHDMLKKTFDDTESWTKYDTGQGTLFRYSVSGIKPGPLQTVAPNLLCSHYPTVANNARTNKTISQTQNGTAIDIIDNDYSDATAFAAAVVGMEIAYELATPTTSSVTPTNLPIRTLSGYNHIESTTGDMEVEYINQRYQPLLDAAAIMIENNVTTLRTTPAPVQSIQREELQPISLEEKVKESAELADLTEEEEEENDYED